MLYKNCKDCYHCFELNKQLYCGIDGLECKRDYCCDLFEISCARNMYSLCSSSECINCQYYIKEFHYCNIGGEIKYEKK